MLQTEKARHLLQVREKLNLLNALKKAPGSPDVPQMVTKNESSLSEERKWELAKMVCAYVFGYVDSVEVKGCKGL